MPYIKKVFDVTTFEQAKHVVLTTDPNNPKKFENETKFLVDTIANKIGSIGNDSIVLDFGCGMGRVSKGLIDKFNCKVIGVDISDSMLTFARLYTANIQKFVASKTCPDKDSVDVCIAVLVLQHTENPEQEISNIYNSLKPGGYLVVVNEDKRYVPSDVDSNRFIVWEDDGFDIFKELNSKFTLESSVPYMDTDKKVFFYRK